MSDSTKTQNKTVIGIGGAGKNVLVQMGPREGVKRVYVNSGQERFDGSGAEEVIWIDRQALSSKRDVLESQMGRLQQVCAEAGSLVVILGLSGFTGSRVLAQLVDSLIDRTVEVVAFTPFQFEQQDRFHSAQDSVARLEAAKGPRIHLIDLNVEREAMSVGGSLQHLLQRANEKAIAIAFDPAIHGIPDAGSDALSAIHNLSPAELISKVRLACRVVGVSITPVEVTRDGVGEVSYGRVIEGDLDCRNFFGNGRLTFRIHSESWSGEPDTGLEDFRVFAEAERLQGYRQRNEAVIVSCEVCHLVDNDFCLMDPEVFGMGIAYEELSALMPR